MRISLPLPKVEDVRIQECEYRSALDPRWSEHHPQAILKTGGAQLGHRYSIVGISPWLIVRGKGKKCTLTTDAGEQQMEGDPFELLKVIFSRYAHVARSRDVPFCGGAIGALSYDLKDLIEPGMPNAAHDDLKLPDFCFAFFREYFVIDEVEKRVWKVEVVLNDCHSEAKPKNLPKIFRRSFAGAQDDMPPTSNFTRETYCSSVQRAIDFIRQGEIYQANIAQRFEIPWEGDLFPLLQEIDQINPAPMMACLRFPEFSLLSTSPERLLKRRGNLIETSPIKGTRPRGKTPEDDARLREELWTSEKENAELAMIVDLMRNDFGKVALPGSVVVADRKRIESYTNVHHLVATVRAEVATNTSSLDILRACFPGGSITGCPKRRAMEIIEEIEPVKRSFYCGSVGYIDFNGNCDFNIAIRTFLQARGKLFLSLGSGIVADSVSAEEYEETLVKGASMFEMLAKRGG